MKNDNEFARYGVFLSGGYYYTLIGNREIRLFRFRVTTATHRLVRILARLKRKLLVKRMAKGGVDQ